MQHRLCCAALYITASNVCVSGLPSMAQVSGDTTGTAHSGSAENSGFSRCMKGPLGRNFQLPCIHAAFALAMVGTGCTSTAGTPPELF